MTKLETSDLSSVTGGMIDVCGRFKTLTVDKATPKDLAIANRFCNKKLPSKADKFWAAHLAFATGPAK